MKTFRSTLMCSFVVTLSLAVVGGSNAFAASLARPGDAARPAAAGPGDWHPAGADPGVRALAAEPDAETVIAAVLKIVASEVLYQEALKKDDGTLGAAIAIELCKQVRDGLVGSGMRDLFPNESAQNISYVKQFVCLGMDGKLTERNWKSATAKEQLVRDLRRQDPNMADAAEVANFIAEVLSRCQSR